MTPWLVIVLAGLLTFSIRFSFIYLIGRTQMPGWFMSALRYVPVAVLTAIIVPETLSRSGTVDATWRNPQIWAAVIAILVGLRVKNVLVIIAAGMIALVIFQRLL